jgi:hypothetical protein
MTDTERHDEPEPADEPAEEPSHEGPHGPEPEQVNPDDVSSGRWGGELTYLGRLPLS